MFRYLAVHQTETAYGF